MALLLTTSAALLPRGARVQPRLGRLSTGGLAVGAAAQGEVGRWHLHGAHTLGVRSSALGGACFHALRAPGPADLFPPTPDPAGSRLAARLPMLRSRGVAAAAGGSGSGKARHTLALGDLSSADPRATHDHSHGAEAAAAEAAAEQQAAEAQAAAAAEQVGLAGWALDSHEARHAVLPRPGERTRPAHEL